MPTDTRSGPAPTANGPMAIASSPTAASIVASPAHTRRTRRQASVWPAELGWTVTSASTTTTIAVSPGKSAASAWPAGRDVFQNASVTGGVTRPAMSALSCSISVIVLDRPSASCAWRYRHSTGASTSNGAASAAASSARRRHDMLRTANQATHPATSTVE